MTALNTDPTRPFKLRVPRGIRRSSWASRTTTKLRPKGAWARTPSPGGRLHRVKSAEAEWRNGYLVGYSVLLMCGRRNERPWFYTEPPDDVELCDDCLLVPYVVPLVYHALDELGGSLYVGFSNRIFDRLAIHKKRSPWWSLAARWEFHQYATTKEGLRAEHELILRVKPQFNWPEKGQAWREGGAA